MAKKTIKKTAASPKKDSQIPRSDGWLNVLTGIGLTGRDKTKQNEFDVETLDRQELESIWRGDDAAARIIETPVDEMLREGFELKIQDDAAGDGTPKIGERGAPPAIDEGQEAGLAENGKEPTDPNAKPEDQSKDQPQDQKKPPFAKKDGFPPAGGGQPPGGDPMAAALQPPEKPPGPVKAKNAVAKKSQEDVMAELEKMDVTEKFREALYYERAYGGAGILLGADDGQADLTQPLNLDNIKSFKWMNVLTPRELVPVSWYSDPQAPKFGEPEIYRIQPETMPTATTFSSRKPSKPGEAAQFSLSAGNTGNTGGDRPGSGLGVSVEVHESRLILFRGIKVSRAQMRANNGWGDSVMVRVKKVLSDFQMTWGAAAILMQDFSVAVMKINGLADLIATNNDQIVINRARIADMARSVARAILVDAEGEDYERKATPMTGMPEMLEKFALRLASAAQMPVTLLFGQAPAGLNATGDADIRFFYDRIKARQRQHLQPALKRVLELTMKAKEGPLKGKEPDNWSVDFKPLWQLTAIEEADLRLKQAQADKLYIDSAVATPEEIAASRFGGDAYSTETQLDFEGRDQMATDHEAKQADFEKKQGKLFDKKLKEKPAPAGAPQPGAGDQAPKPPFPPKGE